MNGSQAQAENRLKPFFIISVEEIQDGDIRGQAYCIYCTRPFAFHSLLDFCMKTEEICNRINIPERDGQEMCLEIEAAHEDRLVPTMEMLRITNEAGFVWYEEQSRRRELFAFSLELLYRQNMSWQGRLTARHDRKNFRSTLEFMSFVWQLAAAQQGETARRKTEISRKYLKI